MTAVAPGEVRQPTAAAASPADLDADVLIELHNVHKSFGKKQILRGTNIKVRRGEAVGIIGGSGTGKSTTLRLMAGLLMPDKVQFCRKSCLQRLAANVRPGGIAGLLPNIPSALLQFWAGHTALTSPAEAVVTLGTYAWAWALLQAVGWQAGAKQHLLGLCACSLSRLLRSMCAGPLWM